MTKGPIKNVAASVHQRLLNVAKQTNHRFNDLVQHYALERWLFRLSRSSYSEQFILKGALLLTAWNTPVTRPTRDIDLLGRLDNAPDFIRSVITEIIQTSVEDDGLVFDPTSVMAKRIVEDADYAGVRVEFQGRLGSNRIAMQIDIGFSDVITPAPVQISYPTILDQPPAQLLAYNRETVIAEKYEALVKLGDLNSRLKDFFDIWLLAGHFKFDGPSLAAAVQATFARRHTALEIEPICFTDQFAHDPSRMAQWKAFIRRGLLTEAPAEFPEVVRPIHDFLQPVALAIVGNRPFAEHWPPGGPWRESKTE